MRLYRALLHLYPASFRGEYEEMCAIFRCRLRDRDGFFGRLTLWTGVAWETIMNALAVHWDILRQDLRYTARSLSRARGFATTAIIIVISRCPNTKRPPAGRMLRVDPIKAIRAE